eukprot:GHRR01024913.1.p1 GENE.GHRR01024913.1~~GHRR01024913.1.p1  ORF type:complete len:138 (+),score=12.84 GHRR01024913.1:534-947(+)
MAGCWASRESDSAEQHSNRCLDATVATSVPACYRCANGWCTGVRRPKLVAAATTAELRLQCCAAALLYITGNVLYCMQERLQILSLIELVAWLLALRQSATPKVKASGRLPFPALTPAGSTSDVDHHAHQRIQSSMT